MGHMEDKNASPIASSSASAPRIGSQHTRIHFTEGADPFAPAEHMNKPGGTKPMRRQPLLPPLPVDSSRRRIHSGMSLDGPSNPASYSRPRRTVSTASHKRGLYLFDQDSGFDSAPSTLNAFSDEYDLCECNICEVAPFLTFFST